MLQLKTLGGWNASRDDGAVVSIPVQRVSLLALLVASGTRGISRDRAAALLWPDSPDENARHSLGQSLYALRRDAAAGDVVLGTTTLKLNRDVIRCDAWDLEDAATRSDACRVAELGAGPFLDGVHVRGSVELEHLIDGERDRLARLHADALESLARAEATAGNAARAAEWWRRLAAVQPLSSRVALELVRSLAAAGDRAAAVQAARVHETLVREQLDSAPDPSFSVYVDALRRDATPLPEPARQLAHESPIDLTRGSGEPTPELAPDRAPGPNAATTAQKRGALRFVWATLAAAASLVVIVDAYRTTRPHPALDPKRVYVAWFENRTGDPALDQIGGMASDWVSQGLEQSGLVAVASSARAEDVKEQSSTMMGDATVAPERARLLGAGTLVSGGFYRVADQLRFHVQVSDVARGEVLDSFDATGGTATNPSQPLDVVRQRAIGSLASFVDPRLSSWARVTSKPPSYNAYREFVTGQSIWGSDHRQALSHFLRASELDSTFYAARVEAAILHRLLGECERTESIARELAPKRARLAPYEHHVLDAQVAQCTGDWEGAYREARAVSDLRPGSAFLEYSLALQAMQLGRFGEAKALLDHHTLEQGVAEVGPNYGIVYAQLVSVAGDRDRGINVVRWVRARYPTYARAWGLEITLVARAGRAAETERLIDTMTAQPLVPSSAVIFSLRRTAASLAVEGDTAAAHRTLTRALAVLDRDDRKRAPRTALDRAQLLYDMGQLAEAKALLATLVARDSTDVDARGHLGLIAARRADTAAAVAVDKWLETARPPYVFTRTLYRARIAALLGEHERALELLGSALDEAGRFLVPGYREYPEFACLREDDRFEQLMMLR
jgi:DNA-binding SARP family transcriptional activator